MKTKDLAQGDPALEQAIARAHALIHKKALAGAFTSMVPVPGVDWLVDAKLMTKLVPEINAIFGLNPEQIERLDPQKQTRIQKAVAAVGSVLIGRVITRDLVLMAVRRAGARFASKQAVKYVPLAGQLAAAGIGYAALRYLGDQHIRDCVRVYKEAQLSNDLPISATKPMPVTDVKPKGKGFAWLKRSER